jgi:hypothetical protein
MPHAKNHTLNELKTHTCFFTKMLLEVSFNITASKEIENNPTEGQHIFIKSLIGERKVMSECFFRSKNTVKLE